MSPCRQSSPSFSQLKLWSCLHWPPLGELGTCTHFRSTIRAYSLDRRNSQIILRPRPGYVPKVPTTKPSGEPASAAPGGGRPSPGFALSVRALRHYVDRTQSFRTSDQLFVCHGGRQKGNAVSKQRITHWIVDAITLAYRAQGVPCPFRLRAHSTKTKCSVLLGAGSWRLTDRYL